MKRVETHCSTGSAKVRERSHVSDALRKNGYPRKISHQLPERRKDTTPEWKTTIVIPYVREVSESLRRVLIPLGIRVCFRPASTLRQILSRRKNPVPILEKSGVVYKIPCSTCPASYIGQTGRRLHWKNTSGQQDRQTLTCQHWLNMHGQSVIQCHNKVD